MHFWYPKSFLTLLVISFALVGVPLTIALLNNAFAVDRLAEQSRKAVYQAVQATQASRAMAVQITAMERAARQYMVVAEPSLLAAYEAGHARFTETAAQFAAFPLSREQRARLEEIDAKDRKLHKQVALEGTEAAVADDIVAGFADLFALSQSLITLSNELIDREVTALQTLATETQRVNGRQLLALLPVVLFIVIGFPILIARPIRQIESGIRSIGAAQFDSDITVSGPLDLQNVGRQLNWLRLRLKELEEQKARFLRHVSHELKTPLTALREGSDLLAEGATGQLNGEQREIVRILQDNSLRLRRLIEDLLDYSAITHRQGLGEVKPVKMRDLVSAVVADHKLPLQAKGIRLASRLSEITLPGDAEKLAVIVDNLLSNAVKFTPRNGAIEITLDRVADSAEIRVSDSGPGIAAGERERVFDAFFQGSAEASGSVRGSGLGLSITKELVTAHRGTIQVSEAEAGGALLVVKLPLKTATW